MKTISTLKNNRIRGPLPINDPPPADVGVGIGEKVINDFLAKHFEADPDFYKREKDPIWQADLPAKKPGDIDRVFKIFGKVLTPGVTVDLSPEPTSGRLGDSGRFRAWWATRLGQKPTKDMKTPPNVVIEATILLLLEFTNRKDPAHPHKLDYKFKATIGAYLSLENDETGRAHIRARDWDISIDSLGVDANDKPAPPSGERIGRNSGDKTCEDSLQDLREKITDLFDFGANYAISKLSSGLTASLPLPPIVNLIKAVDLVYDDLKIENDTLKLSAWARPTQTSLRVQSALESSVDAVNSVFTAPFVKRVIEEAPAEPAALQKWMARNATQFAKLRQSRQALTSKVAQGNSRVGALASPGIDTIWLTTDGKIFDIIAKKFLSVHQEACKSIFHVDIAVAYGDISVCYRVFLSNAKGGISGNSVFMGCDVDVAAWGTASVCVRNPCGDDPCASYSLGLGLKGPLTGGLQLNAKKKEEGEDGTKILQVTGFVGDFPGLYVIGLPGIIGDVVNKVLGAATSFLFEAFLNELLQHLQFAVVSIPIAVPGTHVKIKIQDFDVQTGGGTLTLSMKPKFQIL